MRLKLIVSLMVLAVLAVPTTADEVDDYILDLKYGQPDDRVAAAGALGDIGDLRAVDPLIVALEDEVGHVQKTAAEALGKIGDPQAVYPLIGVFEDRERSEEVRYSAAIALGDIGDTRAVDPLMNAVNRGYYSCRGSCVGATEALGEIGDPRAIDPLSKVLLEGVGGYSNYDAQVKAAEALGKIGDPRTVAPLIEALKNKDVTVKCSAAAALGNISDVSAVDPLIAALRDTDHNVRSSAASALGKIGDTRAIEPLVYLAHKDDSPIAREAVAGVLPIDGNDTRAIEALAHLALKDRDQRVRTKAVESLTEIGGPAVDSLAEALNEEDLEIRQRAVAILGDIGDVNAVDSLIMAVRDDDSIVRSSVLWALGEIGEPRAVDPIMEALNDTDSHVRERAVEALIKIGEPSVGHLILALNDSEWLVRYGAASALGEIGNASAVDPLIGILKDENQEVRAVAAEALGNIGDARAIGSLTGSLKDENERVREEASIALVKLEGPSPEDLKAMMIESVEKVETSAFTVDIHQTIKLVNHLETNETLRTMVFETRSVGEGVQNATSRTMKMNMTTITNSDEMGEIVSEIEMYTANDTLYTKIDGNWTRMPGMPEEMWDQQNQVRTQAELLNASEIELVGSEKVNSESAYKVKVVPDVETFTMIISQQMGWMPLYAFNMTEIFEDSEMEWTTWISKGSHLPLKYHVFMKYTTTADTMGPPVSEFGDVEMEIESDSTVVYSSYNVAVDIEVPEEAITAPNWSDMPASMMDEAGD